MSLFYFVVILESPFARLLSVFKLFSFGLIINFIFGLNINISFLLNRIYQLTYMEFLYLVIISQFFNLLLAYLRYKYFLRNKTK